MPSIFETFHRNVFIGKHIHEFAIDCVCLSQMVDVGFVQVKILPFEVRSSGFLKDECTARFGWDKEHGIDVGHGNTMRLVFHYVIPFKERVAFAAVGDFSALMR